MKRLHFFFGAHHLGLRHLAVLHKTGLGRKQGSAIPGARWLPMGKI